MGSGVQKWAPGLAGATPKEGVAVPEERQKLRGQGGRGGGLSRGLPRQEAPDERLGRCSSTSFRARPHASPVRRPRGPWGRSAEALNTEAPSPSSHVAEGVSQSTGGRDLQRKTLPRVTADAQQPLHRTAPSETQAQPCACAVAPGRTENPPLW